MNYLSICSGIEAATVAFHPLGWRPVAFAEIDAFPSAVLAHHYGSNMPGQPLPSNGIPNLGDMTRFQEWPDYAVDLVCGGTPCQAFSVAGLRQGLADPRGNLALTFLAIVDRYRPQWVLWENVPGVLSSDGGRDFASFLGGLGQLGYGWCYRVLDAQYVRVDGYERAVPQRRRRVFVVGYLGDWRRAAAVLSEPESVLGDTPPRRSSGEGSAAGTLGGTGPGGGWRFGADEAAVGQLIANVAPTLDASYGRLHGASPQDLNHGHGHLVAFGGNDTRGPIQVSTALNAHGGPMGRMDFESETFVASHAPAISASNPYGDHESREGLLVAHTLRAEGFDASEDGTGRGTPIVPIAFNGRQDPDVTGNRAGTLNGMSPQDQCIAFDTTQITHPENRSNPRPGDACHPPAAGAHAPALVSGWAVRRLTPTECERLQGFPDGYTDIPHRGRPAADGPRYKALGNSMAVNCMRWIGRRIELVEEVSDELKKTEAA